MGVWHGVILEIEAGVGRLADGDLDPFVGGEAVAGQGDEGVSDGLEVRISAAFLSIGVEH